MYRLNVAVFNVRSNRSINNVNDFKKDTFQETQLLYNEDVKIIDMDGDWTYIEAIEQKKDLVCGDWRGYRGWVPTSHLVKNISNLEKQVYIKSPWAVVYPHCGIEFSVSFGTKFEMVKEEGEKIIVLLADNKQAWIHKVDVKPSCIVADARKFLGSPYFWGGRSSFSSENNDSPTGVDCSGLTNLLYRVKGIDIPRNAGDQYTFCQKITGSDLQPGDLIFSSPLNDPKKIDHVMLYIGEGEIIEARMGIGHVCVDTLHNRFGKIVEELDMEDATSSDVLYYGRCLHN